MSKTWDGKYEGTRDAERPLEDDIQDLAENNRVSYSSSTGGKITEKDGRIDVYGSSDSEKGHSHDWFDIKDGEPGHHD